MILTGNNKPKFSDKTVS